jgi:hypothetical protein
MNDLLELLTPPPERDMPPGRLELRRDSLLQWVEADVRAGRHRTGRFALLRGLRVWLLTAALVLLLLVGVAVGASRASGASTNSRAVVEASVVAAAAPAVASLFVVSANPRPVVPIRVVAARALG